MEGGATREISVFVPLNTRGIIARHLYVALHVRTRAYVCARAPAIARMGISVLLVREVSTKYHVFFGLQFAEACYFETHKHQIIFLRVLYFPQHMFFVFDSFNLSGVGVYLSIYKTRTNKSLILPLCKQKQAQRHCADF